MHTYLYYFRLSLPPQSMFLTGWLVDWFGSMALTNSQSAYRGCYRALFLTRRISPGCFSASCWWERLKKVTELRRGGARNFHSSTHSAGGEEQQVLELVLYWFGYLCRLVKTEYDRRVDKARHQRRRVPTRPAPGQVEPGNGVEGRRPPHRRRAPRRCRYGAAAALRRRRRRRGTDGCRGRGRRALGWWRATGCRCCTYTDHTCRSVIAYSTLHTNQRRISIGVRWSTV